MRVNVAPPSVERSATIEPGEPLLAAVVAGDDDERAVRPHDRLRADEDRARAHRRSTT